MRLLWLPLLLVSCHDTTKAANGDKLVLGDGDHVVVGTVRIDIGSQGDGLVVHMSEGSKRDTRHVTGNREVKFGAHRVRFDEKEARVAIVVRDYKPASPLTSDDALLTADEAMSPRSSGPVDCTSALLSADGKSFAVRCRDTDRTGSEQTINVDVDVVTGTILPI
jgi:hypothetical protein